MRTRERIIREQFAERACRRCGAPYGADSVVILARRPSHWMVMVSCEHCHQRNVYLISFPDPADPNAVAPLDLDSPFAPPPERSPITATDVAAMHEFLQDFSGDFRSIFSTPRSQRKDDPSSPTG
ncbi:MAG: hypothetical protein ACHQ4H_08725 [Ktedonobacterales bacterium]